LHLELKRVAALARVELRVVKRARDAERPDADRVAEDRQLRLALIELERLDEQIAVVARVHELRPDVLLVRLDEVDAHGDLRRRTRPDLDRPDAAREPLLDHALLHRPLLLRTRCGLGDAFFDFGTAFDFDFFTLALTSAPHPRAPRRSAARPAGSPAS